MDSNLFPLKLQGKFIRNIERYGEVTVDDHVEIVQAKLSLVLVNMLSGDFAEIIGPNTSEEELRGEYCVRDKTGELIRRNSPVSVIRGQERLR
jgi:hypothetical protein